jgi:hypothetical protein
MLQMRLRFIPDPHAQERYLQGAVAEVLSAAHGRIIINELFCCLGLTGHQPRGGHAADAVAVHTRPSRTGALPAGCRGRGAVGGTWPNNNQCAVLLSWAYRSSAS